MPENPDRTFGQPDDDPFVDDDTPISDSDDGGSDLDDLKRELADTPDDSIERQVPGRNIILTFATNLSMDELNAFNKRAQRRTRSGGKRFDAAFAAALILAEKNTAITVGDVKKLDGDGHPLTLRSMDLLDLLGVATAADAARTMYGRNDGPLISDSARLIKASGFSDSDDDDVLLGPTG